MKVFDKGLQTGMIPIDLQKVFHTIGQNILLQKLEYIDFRENTLLWFKSYLSESAFIVNVNNKFSNIYKLSCGDSQESILGLSLFLVKTNDRQLVVSTNLLLYTDDSDLRRVTRGGRRVRLPCPFLDIGRKNPNYGKKCPDCGHPCRAFLFYVVDDCLSKCPNSKKTSQFLRIPGYAPGPNPSA